MDVKTYEHTAEVIAFHDSDLEQALLGALHINPAMLDTPEVVALDVEDFGALKHQWFFEAFRQVHQQNPDLGYLDEVLVKSAMGKRFEEAGGFTYLLSLDNACRNSLNAPDYALVLRRNARHRHKLEAAEQVFREAYQDDPALLEQAIQRLRQIAGQDTSVPDWAALVAAARKRNEDWQANPRDIRGLATGILDLDHRLGGIQHGLISIYGATSMGKSMFCRQLARQFAADGAHVLLLPTEMSPAEVIDNMAGEMIGLPVKKLRSGRLTPDERQALWRAMDRLAKLPITVSDHPAPTAHYLRSLVRELQREKCSLRRPYGCDVVIVDSASNMSVPGEREIYNITRSIADELKNIAYEEQVPIIASWQIGRNDKYRASPLPRLSDGKGASEIEYNSHVVLGLFRPHYYLARGQDVPETYRNCTAQQAFLFILKDRSGGDGDDTIPTLYRPGHGLVSVDTHREAPVVRSRPVQALPTWRFEEED
jgi:replicative DNA helicase